MFSTRSSSYEHFRFDRLLRDSRHYDPKFTVRVSHLRKYFINRLEKTRIETTPLENLTIRQYLAGRTTDADREINKEVRSFLEVVAQYYIDPERKADEKTIFVEGLRKFYFKAVGDIDFTKEIKQILTE